MSITSSPVNDFKHHTLKGADGEGFLSISTSFEEGLTTLSVHDSPGDIAMVKLDELAEVVGAGEKAESPEVERHTAETAEKIVREESFTYTISDRVHRTKTLEVKPGGLGDNLVLTDGEGFRFTLGLATVEAIAKAEGLLPGPELSIMTPEDVKKEAEKDLSRLEPGAAAYLMVPKDIGGIEHVATGETAETIVRANKTDPREFFVPGGGGYAGKWWLTAKAIRELGLTAEDFDTTYTEQRPEWLEAEVIRSDLDDERVFAVRDEDNDWLIYGDARDGDYVMSYEAETDFSDVEIVKA